jgi:hypothetical protein
MADELSAIPKYLSGRGASGGAGRTASGLAMLMGNASKILQTVAANIDRDVMDPRSPLFDMIMLTDTSGLLTGEEQVRVMGVSVAVQKETQRARQLEFLQATANPIDAQIMGRRAARKSCRPRTYSPLSKGRQRRRQRRPVCPAMQVWARTLLRRRATRTTATPRRTPARARGSPAELDNAAQG